MHPLFHVRVQRLPSARRDVQNCLVTLPQVEFCTPLALCCSLASSRWFPVRSWLHLFEYADNLNLVRFDDKRAVDIVARPPDTTVYRTASAPPLHHFEFFPNRERPFTARV